MCRYKQDESHGVCLKQAINHCFSLSETKQFLEKDLKNSLFNCLFNPEYRQMQHGEVIFSKRYAEKQEVKTKLQVDDFIRVGHSCRQQGKTGEWIYDD